uniref:HTH_Tnp_Tc3_2 domain-containing protein n=2 Tax=Caenorhabditis japonica TaxID=281687 RepID=A0A8R1EN52_CAEJA
MAIIRGRQMGLDMPTLAKQFKTSKSVIWATSNTPNLSKATGRPLKTSSRDDRIIVRMSKKNPRLTSTDINSELKDRYGVQVSKDTVKRRLRHALLFRRRPVNKPMIPEKNRSARLKLTHPNHRNHGELNVQGHLGEGNDTIWKISDGYWVVVPTGQRSETLFPLFQGLDRTASSERYDLAKPISRPEFLRASLGATQGSMDQDPTSNPDELNRVHAKRCEAVIKVKGMATKY